MTRRVEELPGGQLFLLGVFQLRRSDFLAASAKPQEQAGLEALEILAGKTPTPFV